MACIRFWPSIERGIICIIENGELRKVTLKESLYWFIKIEETTQNGFSGTDVPSEIKWWKMIRAALK